MYRLLTICAGCAIFLSVATSLGGMPALATPPTKAVAAQKTRPEAGFHPVKAVRARLRQRRALRKLERVVLARPRLAVRFEERYGKIGGKNQFGARGPLAMLGLGTIVNIGGFIQSEQLIPYLIAGGLVDLSAFATHIINNRRQRRKTIVSMVEDATISNTCLRPFRAALGMTDKGHRLGRFPFFAPR
jgi:hypothetical protein